MGATDRNPDPAVTSLCRPHYGLNDTSSDHEGNEPISVVVRILSCLLQAQMPKILAEETGFTWSTPLTALKYGRACIMGMGAGALRKVEIRTMEYIQKHHHPRACYIQG
jgi:Holliday junction resolvasome RuvABC endonuclease subunit